MSGKVEFLLEMEAAHWPTAISRDMSGHGYHRRPDGSRGATLAGAVKMWPTPNASEAAKAGSSGVQAEKMLLGGVAAAWPTPRAAEGRGEPLHRKGPKLSSVAPRWPTPSGLAGGQSSRGGDRQSELLLGGAARSFHPAETTGALGRRLRELGDRCRLSPRFVEWLMGLPEGWISRGPSS